MVTRYYDSSSNTFLTMNTAQKTLVNAIHIDTNIISDTNVSTGQIGDVMIKYNHIELDLSDYLSKDGIFNVFTKLRTSTDFCIDVYDVKKGIIRLETRMIVDKIESYLTFDRLNNGSANTLAFTALAINEAVDSIVKMLHKILIESLE